LIAHELTHVVQQESIIQRKGHKPRIGDKIRYPATAPTEGDIYTVISADEGGGLSIRKDSDNRQSNVDWKRDNIWLIYPADPKDTDMRQGEAAWAGLSKPAKVAIYNNAKAAAVGKIKDAAAVGMLNSTNKQALINGLTWTMFNKVRKGEWTSYWEEPGSGGRKWKFTIDMDQPLETSWQEPHVGWEVKLEDRGVNGVGTKHPDFSKAQGHIWLNAVPEFRKAE
jgi:hypothetical protein